MAKKSNSIVAPRPADSAINLIERQLVYVHDQPVLLDSDVAAVYGVETKRINEAVGNNPDKFPDGYVLLLEKDAKKELVENFDRFRNLKHSTATPKAFTEKGLYMLATILKSPRATETTISIVETFARVRELNRIIAAVPEISDKSKQKTLLQRSSQIMSELINPGLSVESTETSIELNLALMKIKHVVKKSKK